jgi:hypothetical protein
MGVADQVGTIARGQRADLVLLTADPLADIANTTAIEAVFLRGRAFDRAALDDLIASVASEDDIATNDWPRLRE